MSELLFVVHRYAPYPGGSEYNVQRLAEEALRRGHEVAVLADTHLGDYRSVHVTSDRRAMLDRFDLIVVHGDLSPQKEVLANAHRLQCGLVRSKLKDGLGHRCSPHISLLIVASWRSIRLW